MDDTDKKPLQMGMAAAGWCFVYHCGVAHAIQQHGTHLHGKFVGSSGGSLIAAVLALNYDILEIKDYLLRCVKHCHQAPVYNAFRLREYVLGCIQSCTDNQLHVRPGIQENRLHISVTLLPALKNVFISEFNTNEEVIEALAASCCMSPLAGFPFKLKRDDHLDGKWVFDGGLTFMHPHFGKDTVIVSPFYWTKADIKPSEYIPVYWALYPPSVEEMERLFWLGFKDANAWLDKNGHKYTIPETMHVPTSRGFACETNKTIKRRSSSSTTTSSPETPQFDSTSSKEHIGVKRAKSMYLKNRRKAKLPRHAVSSPMIQQSRKKGKKIFREVLNLELDTHYDIETFHNELSNKKLFKSRSFIRKLCSWFLDIVFLLCCLTFLTPLAYLMLYIELVSRAVFSATTAVVVRVEQKRRAWVKPGIGPLSIRSLIPDYVLRNFDSWDDCKGHINSVFHPRLFLSSLPIIGKYFKSEEVFENVENQSLLYRVLKFTSIIKR